MENEVVRVASLWCGRYTYRKGEVDTTRTERTGRGETREGTASASPGEWPGTSPPSALGRQRPGPRGPRAPGLQGDRGRALCRRSPADWVAAVHAERGGRTCSRHTPRRCWRPRGQAVVCVTRVSDSRHFQTSGCSPNAGRRGSASGYSARSV